MPSGVLAVSQLTPILILELINLIGSFILIFPWQSKGAWQRMENLRVNLCIPAKTIKFFNHSDMGIN